MVTRYGTFDRPKSRARKKEIALIAKLIAKREAWGVTKDDIGISLCFIGAHGGADVDNLTKLVLDSLKGIIWEDDRQVVKQSAAKQKLNKGEAPKTVAIIWRN